MRADDQLLFFQTDQIAADRRLACVEGVGKFLYADIVFFFENFQESFFLKNFSARALQI